MSYYFLRFFSSFISKLSDRGIERSANVLTFLAFDVLRLRRKLCLQNLDRVFGDKFSKDEKLRIAKASVKNFVLTVFEFFRGYGTNIANTVEFKGEQYYLDALKEGRGAYIVCCHLGNWEAMGAAISKKLRTSRVIVKRVGSPSTDKFVRELRDKNGFAYVERKKKGDGLKGIFKALEANESIGFVMDQSRPGEPRMDFFGHPAKTNTSLAAIWQRKHAPVLHSFIRRIGVSKHIVEFFPETKPIETQDKENDIIINTKIFTGLVEQMVLQNPEQYLWMHNRWK